MLRDLVMTGSLDDIDVVHCHTWYTHLAGCLVKVGPVLALTGSTGQARRNADLDAVRIGACDR